MEEMFMYIVRFRADHTGFNSFIDWINQPLHNAKALWRKGDIVFDTDLGTCKQFAACK